MMVVNIYKLCHSIRLSNVNNKCVVKYMSTSRASASRETNLKNYETRSLGLYTSVQDYYAGKSVFITGGTGFLGKALLEQLLYTCTNIDKIYLLVREKNGETISHRLEKDIFKNPLFDRLKKRMPDSLNKVVPIAGDITEPGLAIKSDDIQTLAEKVSVVFHVAASVMFNEPWLASLKSNFEGTTHLLQLCHRMENLKIFVHVSSVYAFTKDIGDKVIEEKLYPAPAEIERVYDFAKKYNNDEQKSKEFLCGRANPYTYAKALAETYVAEHHGHIPTCIVRPSIVGPKIDEPQIGWLDNWFGSSLPLYNVAIGLNRVTPSKGDQISDMIPVDYVANTCIIAAAKHDGSKDILVYNSCSSEVNPVTWREAHKLFNEDTVKHGWNIFPFPFTLFIQSRTLDSIVTFFLQVFPAYFADFYLVITGNKPKYIKTQGRAIRLRDSLKFFTLNSWVIKSGNVRSLYSSLSEHDRRLFPCDPTDIDWKKYMYNYSQGVNKFLLTKTQKK